MILMKMRERGPTPRKLAKRLRGIQKEAWQGAGEQWHTRFRRKHFTQAGAREYGYLPRRGENIARGSKAFNKSYTGRKLAIYHHTRPLVFTGHSEALTRIRDVRATARGTRVVLHAPGFNRRAKGSRIDMRREATFMSPPEQRAIVAGMDRKIDKHLKSKD